MIHYFKAKNFYSIRDEVLVNLEAKTQTIKCPEFYLDAPLEKKVTKICFIGGKNASGKTNTLRVLAFLRHFLTGSVNIIAHTPIPLQSFIMDQGSPSVVEVAFSIDDGNVYTYKVEALPEVIISERLEKTYFKTQRNTTATVFYRKKRQNAEGYDFEASDDLKIAKNLTQLDSMLAINSKTSAVALLSNFDGPDGLLRRIVSSWVNVASNILQFGITDSEMSLTGFSTVMLGEMYESPNLKPEIDKILEKYNLGFADIYKKKNDDQILYGIRHSYGDEKFDVPMRVESNGTKRIIMLMRFVLAALLTGGVAVIDELDAFLHPDIYDDIVDMFMSTNINNRGAQLIFSSHNYTVLSRLDKQQILLSDRSPRGGTDIWRLDDMQGLRSDDNFYAKYLSGAYGGKPKIAEGSRAKNGQ